MEKQALIERYRDINVAHRWWDSVYDDFYQICKILGLELGRNEPSFSGFASQGDGASFTGIYRAFLGYDGHTGKPLGLKYVTATTEIREYAPKDEELHRIADELFMLSLVYFPVHISITRRGPTGYVHEQTMQCYAEPMEGDPDAWSEEAHARVNADGEMLMRDLARWLYRKLDDEYDYLTSDEAVWDTIEANGLCGEE